MKHHWLITLAVALSFSNPTHATKPDAATQRWWSHIEALANDDMRGRDTGSPEHRLAQEYVVKLFEQNGLSAAGEQGFFQSIPLQSYRQRLDKSSAVISRNGRKQTLGWLRDIAAQPLTGYPANIQGRMVFVGSDNAKDIDVNGAVLVRLLPARLVGAPPIAKPPTGAVAVLGIDSILGPEPNRWPVQNATSITFADSAPAKLDGVPVFRFNPASAPSLFKDSGHTYQELLALTSAGKPVPSFVLPGTLSLSMQYEAGELKSDNVIALLPGSDPKLASEYLVLTAHIDGYGIGAPWGKDTIYNGAFDDAAYVATLLDFAQQLHESKTQLRRSLLFVIVTGEEKGLLGSKYFVKHLTVPRERIVANINLDQLRPVFPLHTLTMHAVDDSSLGDTAKQIGDEMGIDIQADPEPLRQLVRRSDNFPFMEIGVPATGFIFGYTPGTADEIAYRRWYTDQYHTPKDDLNQPWVPEAAAKFNTFFAKFVIALANADAKPEWKAGSAYAASPAK
ncbi:MAG: M28 family peptidase [Arenimonas sp.]